MRPFPRNLTVATVSPPPKGLFTRVEVSALKHAGMPGLHGSSPLLRLQSDERLVALIRRGNHGAFEALVSRYQSRLLAFCRHMLGSQEDAEDVLQEVFAAAFNAMLADDRPINVRPWLYRIARNRSLNHLRKQQPIGVDSMDVHYSEGGLTTADKVHKREDFRLLLEDVQGLPETQRTALLLREIDALSYDQIAEAMDTTVPSVKSLLVRARVSLAEAAEARQLSCEEVRLELGEVAEGLKKMPAPVRRHVKTCDRCAAFRTSCATPTRRSPRSSRSARCSSSRSSCSPTSAPPRSGGGSAAAGSAGASAAGSAAASSAISAGVSAVATKAAAGVAAAAIVTAGAVEVRQATVTRHQGAPTVAALSTGGVAAPAAASTHARPGRAPGQAEGAPGGRRARRVQARDQGEPGDDRHRAASAGAHAHPGSGTAAHPAAHADRHQRRHAAGGPDGRDREAGRLAERHERPPGRDRPRRRPPRPPRPWARAARRLPRRPAAPRRTSRPRPPVPEPGRTRGYPAGRVISLDDFQKVDMRVGRVMSVDDFPEARRPAWKLKIDFGPEIGVRRSSAQIKHYGREELEGRLVVGVVNFPPLRMGAFKSEVLVLGALDDDKGVVLLRPDEDVAPGDRIA